MCVKGIPVRRAFEALSFVLVEVLYRVIYVSFRVMKKGGSKNLQVD